MSRRICPYCKTDLTACNFTGCYGLANTIDNEIHIRKLEAEVEGAQLAGELMRQRYVEECTRTDKLEAEVAKLKAAIAQSCDEMRYETLSGCERAEAAEAKLKAVEGLPEKWLEHYPNTEAEHCVTDLESALRGD